MKIVTGLVCWLLAAALPPGAGAASVYRVVGVADGDTLTALSSSRQQVKCRLYGIDAPEKKQAYGKASKASLAALSFGRSAVIDITGRDRYGRALCKVRVNGVDVSREQIARGMAWMYRRYTRDADYSDAEMAAQAHGLGVWRDSDPVPPWDFRRRGKARF